MKIKLKQLSLIADICLKRSGSLCWANEKVARPKCKYPFRSLRNAAKGFQAGASKHFFTSNEPKFPHVIYASALI